LQTIFHSSGVVGGTKSLEYFTSAMSASFSSAFIASSPGQLQSEAAKSLSLKVH